MDCCGLVENKKFTPTLVLLGTIFSLITVEFLCLQSKGSIYDLCDTVADTSALQP